MSDGVAEHSEVSGVGNGAQPIKASEEKTSVLLGRYDQLNVAHYQHNQVIHTTFYLSVVFFAGFLSIIFTADTEGSFVPLISVFGSTIFLLLGVWACATTEVAKR